MLTNVITAYYKGKELISFHGVKLLAFTLTVEGGYLRWFDSEHYDYVRVVTLTALAMLVFAGNLVWRIVHIRGGDCRLGDCRAKEVAALISWDYFR